MSPFVKDPAHVHDSRERYDGPARIGESVVQVQMRGHFQPIDGRFHWWGRIGSGESMEGHTSGSTVTLETPYGVAQGRLSDVDPWGRLRIAGTGRPPF